MKFITLTQGLFTVVDEADFDVINARYWHAHQCNGRFYACASIGGKKVYLHRHLMNYPQCEVDHKNRLTLDNRRENLRLCDRAQNVANARFRPGKSGFLGVDQIAKGRWRAYLSYNNRRHTVGHFNSPEEAARARDAAAFKLRGDFAILNFQNDADAHHSQNFPACFLEQMGKLNKRGQP